MSWRSVLRVSTLKNSVSLWSAEKAAGDRPQAWLSLANGFEYRSSRMSGRRLLMNLLPLAASVGVRMAAESTASYLHAVQALIYQMHITALITSLGIHSCPAWNRHINASMMRYSSTRLLSSLP